MAHIGINTSFSAIHKAGSHTSPHHNHPQKKHIKNAKELEKRRRNELVYQIVHSWLTIDQDPIPSHLLRDYFKCIKQLVKLMGYRYQKTLLFPTLIYADKFIQIDGPVSSDRIFHLLLISALVAVKMWEDTGIDMDLISQVSGLPKKEISDMERNFLEKLEYKLFLTDKDLASFTAYHQKKKQ